MAKYPVKHIPNHPYRNPEGNVFVHRLVMEQHIGRYLKPTEVVHHINGNRKDNRIENLMLFPNLSAHTKYHMNVLDTRKKISRSYLALHKKRTKEHKRKMSIAVKNLWKTKHEEMNQKVHAHWKNRTQIY